jgi:hypothetical protein
VVNTKQRSHNKFLSGSKSKKLFRTEAFDPDAPPHCVICSRPFPTAYIPNNLSFDHANEYSNINSPLNCSMCQKQYHSYCLEPPILVRTLRWNCPDHGSKQHTSMLNFRTQLAFKTVLPEEPVLVAFNSEDRFKHNLAQNVHLKYRPEQTKKLEFEKKQTAKVRIFSVLFFFFFFLVFYLFLFFSIHRRWFYFPNYNR